MKKYLAEMVGTMVLVLMGCGSAVFNGGCGTPAQVLMVAVAFGLSVVAPFVGACLSAAVWKLVGGERS